MSDVFNYQLLVKNAAGEYIGQITQFRNLRFGKRLNNYGSAEFDISVRDGKAASLIQLRKNTIEIRKKYTIDTEVWAGEQAVLRASLEQSGNSWMTITCYTFFEQLQHRMTGAEVSFDDTDQGQIAWSLINTTNMDSDTGITQGIIEATTQRDRTYYNQNVYEAITNLSETISGFDFEVTDSKEFNVYSVKGVDKTDSIIIKYGKNAINVVIEQDFRNPVTRAVVLGEASGEDSLQRVEREDAGQIAEYGLREGRIQDMDVSTVGSLQAKGDSLLRKFSSPLIKVDFNLVRNFEPSVENFSEGDSIRLILKDGYFNIDEEYRIFEWNMTIDETSTENLSLVLGKFTL